MNVFFFNVFDGILQSVGESRREWTIIGCDALPYTIGHRVLENVHSCPQCHCEFLSEEELVEHSKKTSMKVIPGFFLGLDIRGLCLFNWENMDICWKLGKVTITCIFFSFKINLNKSNLRTGVFFIFMTFQIQTLKI